MITSAAPRSLLLAAAVACLPSFLQSMDTDTVTSFRLGSSLGSHMVLQRDATNPFWGTDKPGTGITIRVDGQSWTGMADAEGRWEIPIGPFQPGEPLTIEITGTETHALEDVLVGEVWIASGQSNMEWPLIATVTGEQDVANANHPNIRLLTIPHAQAVTPQAFVKNDGWRACTPESAIYFSAVAYHFACALQEELDVPIGIVANAWGGAGMEAYTPLDRMAQSPDLAWTAGDQRASLDRLAEPLHDGVDTYMPEIQHIPALLYNAMVHPVAPLRARGIIWYQGETNAIRAHQYVELTRTMVEAWREDFRDPEMPFLYVQLAGLKFDWASWPYMFDAQRRCLEIPHTAMATAIDLGDPGDIHPRNKRDVGLRLALAARAIAYGHDVVHSGPLVTSAVSEGRDVRVTFDHIGSGLVATDEAGHVSGFELAGPDGVFHPANARIDGATVVVSADSVSDPQIVRYDWDEMPGCALRNREGLPASPFHEVIIQTPR